MMIFCSKQRILKTTEILSVIINDMPFERVTCFKCIGVIIDSNLTWSHHINYISNILTRICGVLSRLKHYVPVLILKIIYNSLFLSHLNYGITAWGFNVGPRIKTLQKRQSDSYIMLSIIHIPLQCLRIFNYYRQWTFSSQPASNLLINLRSPHDCPSSVSSFAPVVLPQSVGWRFIDGSIACGVREAPLHAYALHRWQHCVRRARSAATRLFGTWHHNTDWQMRAKRVLQSPSMVSCRRSSPLDGASQMAALRAACAKRRYTPMRFIDGSIACGVREAPLHAYSVDGTTALIGRCARERSVFFRVLQW